MRAPHGSSKRLGYVVIVVVVLLASGFAAARALTSSIGGHDRSSSTTPTTTVPPTVPATTAPTAVRDAAAWPFSSDSPWNVPLGSGATFGFREVAAGGEINTDNGFGVSVGGAGYPLIDQAATRADHESHYSLIRPDGVTADEWYEYQDPGNPNRNSSVTDLRGSGLRTNAGPGTGPHHQQRASQVSQLGGLIRLGDLEKGVIPHALGIALPNRTLQSGYVWPAYGQDGDARSAYYGFVPMGSLVAIPSWIPMPTGLSRAGQMIWYALSHYGAYVVDRTGPPLVLFAEAAADTSIDPARAELPAIVSQLRVVTNNSQYQVGGPGNRLAPFAPPLR